MRRSALLFLLLTAALAGLKLLFDYYPGDFPHRSQAAAFTWPLIAGIVLLAFAGLLAERSAKLPEPFSDLKRERRAFVVAALAGVVYGLITIARDLSGAGETLVGDAWPHMALPWSIPFYAFGAILLEFMLRLGALCVLFWLLHVVILRRRLRLPAFWAVAAFVALYEIWPLMQADFAAGDWRAVGLGLLGPLYLSNVFEGWLVLKYGWFSPIVFRMFFYLLWHILYGGLAAP